MNLPGTRRPADSVTTAIGSPQEEKMLRVVLLSVALLTSFVLGAASGYAAKALNTPPAAVSHAAAACPQGTHAEVWYSAGTWACVSN